VHGEGKRRDRRKKGKERNVKVDAGMTGGEKGRRRREKRGKGRGVRRV
jgi:hypothetical protein